MQPTLSGMYMQGTFCKLALIFMLACKQAHLSG